jgi:hypothetical protein
MESIVSCQGENCNVCAGIETVSNLYNYLLGISLVLAILVLVLAGFFYLGSAGNQEKLSRSRLFARSGILGFSLILIGWIIIHSLFFALGFKNAGSWWQFQCTTEKPVETRNPANRTGMILSSVTQPADYPPTFRNLADLIKSQAPQGKILGPDSAANFIKQIEGLTEGQSLKFLAPVRLKEGKNTREVFLPLLALRKSNGKIQMEGAGEYWNIVQNELLNSGGQAAAALTGINGNFDKIASARNISPINSGGETITGRSLSSLNPALEDVNNSLLQPSSNGLPMMGLGSLPRSNNLRGFLSESQKQLEGKVSYQKVLYLEVQIITAIMKIIALMLVQFQNGYTKSDSTQFLNPIINDNASNITEDDTSISDGNTNDDADNSNINDNYDEEAAAEEVDENGIHFGIGNYDFDLQPDSANSVKKELRLIHDYDPLRYKMIFRYLYQIGDVSEHYIDTLNDTSESSTYNAGFYRDSDPQRIYVDYTSPITEGANRIIHETTHAATDYLNRRGLVNVPDVQADKGFWERTATANGLGSLCRGSAYEDMSEFPGQTKKISYQGEEVRGFLSRLRDKVNSSENAQGSATYYNSLSYVATFGNLEQGAYCYGDDQAKMVLGLSSDEEELVKSVVEYSGGCTSKPPADLPQISECAGAPELIIGGMATSQ